jgi:hypothetical protein
MLDFDPRMSVISVMTEITDPQSKLPAPVEQLEPGQAAFNDLTLKYYDWLLELTCNRIWRCSIERTLQLYQRYLASNHLEVGVGTGYFLDRSSFPVPEPRLALLDLNPHCLKHTEASFHNMQIDIIGCVAQFSGRA